jgi:hypothetical protein
MKSASVIFAALWQAWFRPMASLEQTHLLTPILLALARIALAVFLSPVVLITGMISDSGTPWAVQSAYIMMYAMFLLCICSPIFWSWRCAAASGLIFVSWILVGVMGASKLDDQNRNNPGTPATLPLKILFFFLWTIVLVITEALPSPFRNSFRFIRWCFADGMDAEADTKTFLPQNDAFV